MQAGKSKGVYISSFMSEVWRKPPGAPYLKTFIFNLKICLFKTSLTHDILLSGEENDTIVLFYIHFQDFLSRKLENFLHPESSGVVIFG